MSKYGVIYKESYQEYDSYDNGYNTKEYETLKSFDTEKDLKDWIVENTMAKYGSKTVVAYIKYDELKATQTVTIDFK